MYLDCLNVWKRYIPSVQFLRKYYVQFFFKNGDREKDRKGRGRGKKMN